jgi:leader peptidase (prepilin peptidase)/N-methyltransferase
MLALAAILAVSAAAVDWRIQRLPHILTLPAAVMATMAQGFWGPGWFHACAGAALGFAALKGAQLFCRWRKGRDVLGSGDAVLMLSLGALTGPELLPVSLGCSVLTVATAALIAGRSGKDRVPFGPHLTTVSLGVWLVSRMNMG